MSKRTFPIVILSAALLMTASLFGACDLEPNLCGNNAVDAGEECDDGNRDDCDGCSSICLTEGFDECIAEGEGEGPAEGEGEGAFEGEGEGEGAFEGEGEGEGPFEGEGEGEGPIEVPPSRYVRVCSLTTTDDSAYSTKYPGPDIDAVGLFAADGSLKGYAYEAPVGKSEIQSADDDGHEDHIHDDQTEALGAPDWEVDPDVSKCTGFTSIGMKGHYLVVGFEEGIEMEVGDKIVVYEVPRCTPRDPRAEPGQVDVSVQADDGRWYPVSPHTFQHGETEFEVGIDDGGNQECEPCQDGNPKCDPDAI